MAKFSTEIQDLILNKLQDGREEPFIILDLGDVVDKARAWRALMPRVEPFYAVKCNPDQNIVQTLYNCNVNFDCASKCEIQQCLDAGASPDQIIFANPCKMISHVKFARQVGVKMLTFDNEDELRKISKYHPEAEMVLRIVTDDSNAVCRLSNKFGAHMENVPGLLAAAKSLGVAVIGISFHVGSGSEDATAYSKSIRNAHRCFVVARKLGIHMTLLDIGGGFSGVRGSEFDIPTDITLNTVAETVNPVLDELFPEESGVRIIAEPGRYFVHSCGVTVASIIGRRVIKEERIAEKLFRQNQCDSDSEEDIGATPVVEQEDEEDAPEVIQADVSDSTKFMYYINEGLYGSFNSVLYDHRTLVPKALPQNTRKFDASMEEVETYAASVWGPTCDGLDCITGHVPLPELDIGDFVYFEDTGAYSCAAGSTFNGFDLIERFYVNDEILSDNYR